MATRRENATNRGARACSPAIGTEISPNLRGRNGHKETEPQEGLPWKPGQYPEAGVLTSGQRHSQKEKGGPDSDNWNPNRPSETYGSTKRRTTGRQRTQVGGWPG